MDDNTEKFNLYCQYREMVRLILVRCGIHQKQSYYEDYLQLGMMDAWLFTEIFPSDDNTQDLWDFVTEDIRNELGRDARCQDYYLDWDINEHWNPYGDLEEPIFNFIYELIVPLNTPFDEEDLIILNDYLLKGYHIQHIAQKYGVTLEQAVKWKLTCFHRIQQTLLTP